MGLVMTSSLRLEIHLELFKRGQNHNICYYCAGLVDCMLLHVFHAKSTHYDHEYALYKSHIHYLIEAWVIIAEYKGRSNIVKE